MDADILLKVGLLVTTISMAILGYIAGVLKVLHSKTEKVEKDLSDHKVTVARDYLPRLELVAFEARIEHRFDKLENWLGRRFDMVLGRDANDGTKNQ